MTAVHQGNLERAARSRALFTIEARRLLAQGKPAHAAELCRRGLVHFPYDHLGYILLAQAYLMLGRRDRALLVLRDGYRRTGSPRLDLLRTELADPAAPGTGEESAHEQASPNVPETPSERMETVVEHADAPHPGIHRGADAPPAPNADEALAELAADIADARRLLESVAAPEEDIAEIVPGLAQQPTAGTPEQPPEEHPPTEAEAVKTEERVATEAPAGGETLSVLESVAAPEEDIAAAVLGMAHQPAGSVPPSIEETPAAVEVPAAEAPATPPAATTPVARTAEAPAWSEHEETLESVAAPVEDIADVVLGIAHQPAIQAPAAQEAAEPAAPVTSAAPATSAFGDSSPAGPAQIEPPSGESQAAEPSPAEPSPAEPAAAAPVERERAMVPTVQVLHPPERNTGPLPEAAADVAPPSGRSEPPADAPHARKPDQEGARPRLQSLALHTVKNASRLRSSNLRLIPGLEFAPLRHEDPARRQLIAPLISEPMPQPEISHRARKTLDGGEMPPLPPLEEAHSPFETPMPAEPRIAPAANGGDAGPRGEEGLTPLEELARRLEHARIPAVEEPEQHTAFQPSMMSETLADILVRQGAFAEALKAYQTLARANPERLAHYQQRIAEMQQRIRETHEGDADA
ncbi:MAG TPA: hypothetical protein VHI13_17335 [Candidatus Kapabacteria bacterium]|nr:hypothetical protein [Candidatus Kapabacteria bacterium]